MFCTRFFANRVFAPRFFPKVGASPSFLAAWAIGANRVVTSVVPAVTA